MTAVRPGAPRPDVITDPVRPTTPIEPVGKPAAPTPFEPDLGHWAGVGLGAVLAGSFGLLGGIMLGAPFATSPRGTAVAVGVMGVLALGAGAAGGYAAHAWAKGSHESDEARRVQAEFGTSTLQNAREYMTRFDHDSDGQIDLVNRTGLPGQDERTFTETREQSDTKLEYDWWDDDIDVDTDRWSESRGVSAVDVWESANVAPKDDTVTDVELATLMSRYDVDRNGALTTAEKDAFTAAHPVAQDDWRR